MQEKIWPALHAKLKTQRQKLKPTDTSDASDNPHHAKTHYKAASTYLELMRAANGAGKANGREIRKVAAQNTNQTPRSN
jgi:hypothetical protein